ncbi:MAG: heavy-metal-associated domain-containing protein [Rhodocyclaceae bacterium]
MEAVTLNVRGMTCGGCASSVTRVLSSIDGVQGVVVQLAEGKASMQIDPAKVSTSQLKQAINDAGFEAP